MGEQVEHCNFPGDNKMEGALAADLDRVRDEVTPAQKMWVLDAAMKGQVDQLKMIKKRGIPLSIRGDTGSQHCTWRQARACRNAWNFSSERGALGMEASYGLMPIERRHFITRLGITISPL